MVSHAYILLARVIQDIFQKSSCPNVEVLFFQIVAYLEVLYLQIASPMEEESNKLKNSIQVYDVLSESNILLVRYLRVRECS